MGIDIKLYLPTDVESKDVAEVMAVLMGAKVAKVGRFWHVEGDPKSEGNKDIPGMDNIDVGKQKDVAKKADEWGLSPTFHYGSRFDGKVYNIVHMRSTAAKVALAGRLADWFGGILIPADAYDINFRFKRKAPHDEYGLMPEDNPEWDNYWRALQKLSPLSTGEILAWKPYGAYDGGSALKEEKHGRMPIPKGAVRVKKYRRQVH